MSANFNEIVVSRKAEKAFRRRAIASMPNEHLESLWGKIRGDKIYIHVFMPINHKGRPTELTYEEEDLDSQEDEAPEHNLALIGTIHTHPHCLDAVFSETDMREVQETQDIVMAICSITQDGKSRKSCEIVYWPAPRPMKVIYTR